MMIIPTTTETTTFFAFVWTVRRQEEGAPLRNKQNHIMDLNGMRFKTGQTISINDIQGNGKNILSLVASIFSHIRYIRYLICLDWFRLLECVFAFHMGRRFWHSLRCVFAKHFYHILLGFFFLRPVSSGMICRWVWQFGSALMYAKF